MMYINKFFNNEEQGCISKTKDTDLLHFFSFDFIFFFQSTGNSDEMKRDQMEKLVREELERWDSEASISQPNGRGGSPGSSSGPGTGGLRPRSSSRPGSGQNVSNLI